MSSLDTMTPDELAEYLEKLLAFCRRNGRGKYRITGLRPLVESTERAKDPHKINPRTGKPMRGPGIVTLRMDDEAVQDLDHTSDGDSAWFLLRIRRSVLDRFASPIKLPGELIQ